ncbi:MAG: hypothetical protein DHS20C16_05370 [Phycisphaerae bacterium]|nr:MAG: hypothetical protein DHS20C16_05370 [Phycisphaerae bacterium]
MRIGIALSVALAVCWIVARVSMVMYGASRFHVFLRHGGLEYYFHGETEASGLTIRKPSYGVWTRWPSYKKGSGYTKIPFWILFVPSILITIWLWRTSRILPGKCWNCRYDLTGNVSGTCPECGTPIVASSS